MLLCWTEPVVGRSEARARELSEKAKGKEQKAMITNGLEKDLYILICMPT